MESSSKVQYKVGIFLALGLAAAVISVLALGGDRSLFRSYVRLKASLNQVQGLAAGSVVSLSGVTIGNIEDITFGPDNGPLMVIMKIDKKFQDMIPADSTVEIRTQGALGDKFVYITPGTPSSGIVKEGQILEAAKSSDLMNVIAEKGGEAAKIFDVIIEVDRLMKIINADGRSEKIMKNLAEASTNMKLMSEEARQMMGEIRGQNVGTMASSLKRLDTILAKVEKGEGTLGALVNDPTLHEQLKTFLGGSPRRQYFQSILQNSIEQKK